VVVPIHWGTLLPVTSTGRAAHRRLLVEPPLEFARQCARLAPGVEVRILQPGEGTDM
jgi:hypothetical protein